MTRHITEYGLTDKQLGFAHAYLETANATEAYNRAYDAENMSYKAVTVEAHRTLHHPRIALYIKQQRDRKVKKHSITLDSMTTRLEEITDKAVEDKKYSAAVSSQALVARIQGLDVQQVKVTIKRESTPEERLSMLQSLLERVSQPQPLVIEQEPCE